MKDKAACSEDTAAMNKNTRRLQTPSSTDLPACAESGRVTSTKDGGVWGLMAAGGKPAALGASELRMSGALPVLAGGWLGQLGPDALPIVGAQLFAGDQTIRCSLNSPTINGAWLAASVAVLPLPDLHVRLDTNSNCQLPHGQRTRALQIVIEFHEAGAYSKC